MNGEAFFSRWKNLSMPAQVDFTIVSQPILSIAFQESQKIFKAEFPMENVEATKTKLIGYGFQLLEGRSAFFDSHEIISLFAGIDPNPDNFVCAGIIHTRSVQIGVLLRLEPNKQAEVGFFFHSSKDPLNFVKLYRCIGWQRDQAKSLSPSTSLVSFVNSSSATLGFLTHQWLDFSHSEDSDFPTSDCWWYVIG